MTTPRALPHLAGLDVLRVVAAACVLFAHGGYFLFAAWPAYDVYAFAGWFGTEMFFALAGFLLVAGLLAQPPADARAAAGWWWWRGWRVLPLFWIALLLHGLLAYAAGVAPSISTVLTYAALLQNLAWPHPGLFGEAWNLPVLLLFFVVAPLLAFRVNTTAQPVHRMAWWLLGWLLLGLAVRAAWVLVEQPAWDDGVRKIVLSRLDACVYGGLAACALLSTRGVRWSGARLGAFALLAWGLAGVLFFAVTRDASNTARIGAFVLSGFGCALGVLALASPRRVWVGILALSRWSYALYLINMPVLLAMALAGFGQSTDAGQGVLRFAVWLVLSITLAALLHRYVEVPLLAARARTLARPGAAAADVAGAAVRTIR